MPSSFGRGGRRHQHIDQTLRSAKLKPAGPPKTNAEPVRVRDYGRTQISNCSGAPGEQLLLVVTERSARPTYRELAAQMGPACSSGRRPARSWTMLFWRGVYCVAVLLAAALLTAFLAPLVAPIAGSGLGRAQDPCRGCPGGSFLLVGPACQAAS